MTLLMLIVGVVLIGGVGAGIWRELCRLADLLEAINNAIERVAVQLLRRR
jgi:hypothetical protein